MPDFLLLAGLIGGQENLAALIGEQHAAPISGHEMIGLELLAVHQTQGQTVEDDRAKLLDEIESERGAPGPSHVEESELRIQSHTLKGSDAIGGAETIEE